MSDLPSYAPALFALHRSSRDALRKIVHALPIEPGMSVLDAPCGDGTYLPWLRERVGAKGRVVGADRSPEYLEVARKNAEREGAVVELVEASFDALPSPFDFVWCAHSLYSLPDPAAALASIRKALASGGRVGIVENDSFHHWLLPWPVELELAVKRAQLAALAEQTPHWTKAYVGRNLAPLLREAGFEDIQVRTLSVDLGAPMTEDERVVLRDYVAGLRELTWSRLDADARTSFDAFAGACEAGEDLFGSRLEVVATARKP